MTTVTRRLPSLYIPHGGGPCFFMEPMAGFPAGIWDGMAAYLRGIGGSLGMRPQALLIISAHWEAAQPTVNAAPNPALLFDYYGFPEHTYRLTYPAPGAPRLAAHVRGLLTRAGIASDEVNDRGLDHGVFVPFKLIYPDADIPIVQLSLNQNLDAATHIALGKALAPLRDEGVLIVGSGMSYHNLREMTVDRPQTNEPAKSFDHWLTDAITDPDVELRERKLTNWLSAPGASASHPRPEHLIPLMVAAGAGGTDAGTRTYSDAIFGKPVSGFQFG